MNAAVPRPLRRVAVFGASGLLGSRVVAALRADGAEVIAFARATAHIAPHPGVFARVFDSRDAETARSVDATYDAAILALPASAVAAALAALRGRTPTLVVLADHRIPAPEIPDAAVLRYGDIFGDGVLGRFRPVLEGLAPWAASGREGDSASPLFAPTDPRDIARAAVRAARDAVRGGFLVTGGLVDSPSGIEARFAAALRARGLPVRQDAPRMTPETAVCSAAPEDARGDLGFRPRFDFEASLAELLDRGDTGLR